MIGSVNLSNTDNTINAKTKETLQQGKKAETSTSNQEAYVVDIGKTPEKQVTYSRPEAAKPDLKRIEQLKKEADDALRPLRQMVEALLRQQGLTFKDLSTDGKMVEIDEDTRAEAQRLISEGGEYSIENTSDRLFEFAKAVSGGDKSKLTELKSAIEKGYSEAEKAFGGDLPEICKNTLERTMEKLDKWAASEEN